MFSKDSLYFRQVELILKVAPFVANETDFALKGGTAINLFVQDMPRLSVDIDLIYLPVKERTESLEAISDALEKIADNIEKQLRGSRVQRLQQRGDDGLNKLMVSLGNVKIKIEPSTVLRGSVRGASVIPVVPSSQDFFGYAEMQVVHQDDLYAGKLCAALDRQHPRDFFDIRYLLHNGGISDELIEVFIVYLISGNQSIVKLLQPNFIDIKETFERQFAGMTREPITLSELEETREELVLLINQRLSEQHRDFLIGFKEGHPKWELLDLEGIAELPAVKWKLLNLDRMTANARKTAVKKLSDVLNGEVYDTA